MLATGLAFALLSDVAATAPASWALKRIDLADCNDAAHSALSVFLHSVHDPDSDIVAGVVERSTSPSYFLHLHSQQITKQLRKCSFTDTTYLNTDFCMEIYPRLRSISHDVVAKADKRRIRARLQGVMRGQNLISAQVSRNKPMKAGALNLDRLHMFQDGSGASLFY